MKRYRGTRNSLLASQERLCSIDLVYLTMVYQLHMLNIVEWEDGR